MPRINKNKNNKQSTYNLILKVSVIDGKRNIIRVTPKVSLSTKKRNSLSNSQKKCVRNLPKPKPVEPVYESPEEKEIKFFGINSYGSNFSSDLLVF